MHKKSTFASFLTTAIFAVILSVGSAQDTQKPQFVDCPVAIQALADPATNTAVVFFPDPVAVDNCGDDCVTVNLNQNRKPSGSSFNVGTTVVKFTASDPSGNTRECSFRVVVEPDTEKPKFVFCPIDIEVVVPNKDGAAAFPIFYAEPVATDNFCYDGTDCVTMSLNPNRKPSGDLFTIGSTSIIKFTASDPSGNTNECSFTITVKDDNNRRVLRN